MQDVHHLSTPELDSHAPGPRFPPCKWTNIFPRPTLTISLEPGAEFLGSVYIASKDPYFY